MSNLEKELVKNGGYKEEALLEFLGSYPNAGDILSSSSLVYVRGERFFFPSPVTSEEEKASPEAADRGFRGRVGRHTTSVGATMQTLLSSLSESKALDITYEDLDLSVRALLLHDLKKIEEIRLRKPMGGSDNAYNVAEEHLADLLKRAGYSERHIQYAGSLAHNGAKDLLIDPTLWSLQRICAYLSDDLLQETVIQPDILAKVTRLKTDSKYADLNKAGFPEMAGHPAFTNKDGSPRLKFDVQEEATTYAAKKVSQALGINWQDLGIYLISRVTDRNLYQAEFSGI